MLNAPTMTLPLELRSLLARLQSADIADNQRWILSLLRKEGQCVVTFLWRMLGSESDVLDAYQTAVCQLTQRGPKAAHENLGGYFYRIAMNAGIGILRNRRKRNEHWTNVVDVHSHRGMPPEPEQILDQQQTLGRMRQAISLLPDHLRDVIVLRDLGEQPYEKVASMLNIRVVTVRLYRHQAVVRLAELMKEECGT